MLNVFLDANILYSDPCFEKNKNRVLLDKVSRIGGKLYITDIVYKEMENNFRKQLEEINSKISKIKNDCKIPIEINNIDVEKEIQKMRLKYSQYEEDGKLVKLETKNEFLPEVIERSINRKKPFTETKQEFRDCLIWMTYAHKVEEDRLENCFFITKNSSDFYDKEGNLHEDLVKDSKNIKLHKDIHQFMKNEEETLNKLEDKKYIIDNYSNLDIDSIKSNKTLNKYIEKIVMEYVQNLSSYELGGIYNEITDGAELEEVYIHDLDNSYNDINIDKKQITYFANMLVKAKISLKLYSKKQDIDITVKESDIELIVRIAYDKDIIKSDEDNEYRISDGMLNIELTDDIFIESIDEEDYGSILAGIMHEREMDARAEALDALEAYYNH